jgi:hypothetical protein
VIESITDCAFSWPISGDLVSIIASSGGWMGTYAGSNLLRFEDGFDRCYEPSGHS